MAAASAAAPRRRSEQEVTVLFRTTFRHNTLYDVLSSQPGWKETDSDVDFDFNWADTMWIRDFLDHLHLDDHQRVNQSKSL